MSYELVLTSTGSTALVSLWRLALLHHRNESESFSGCYIVRHLRSWLSYIFTMCFIHLENSVSSMTMVTVSLLPRIFQIAPRAILWPHSPRSFDHGRLVAWLFLCLQCKRWEYYYFFTRWCDKYSEISKRDSDWISRCLFVEWLRSWGATMVNLPLFIIEDWRTHSL